MDGAEVEILPAVGIPVFGFMAEPFILIWWLLRRIFKERPAALMVYNATLASATAVVISWMCRVRVVYEVEDVPKVKLGLGSLKCEKPRLFQHLSWLFASRIQVPLSYRLVVPSRRFIRAMGLPDRKHEAAVVLTGCMDVVTRRPQIATYIEEKRPLRVLFAGKLEPEHGYDVLTAAIAEVICGAHSPGIEFHVCGRPDRSAHFYPPPSHPAVKYYGFVSDEQYKQILDAADVGLALQKSSGLFSDAKTPSKAYEFLASGKLVIATRVGDLDELYPHSAICLEDENGAALASLLKRIAECPQQYLPIAIAGLSMAQKCYSLSAAGRALSDVILAD
jgi:glycosyltransferase involved in cell wall biosynthesis